MSQQSQPEVEDLDMMAASDEEVDSQGLLGALQAPPAAFSVGGSSAAGDGLPPQPPPRPLKERAPKPSEVKGQKKHSKKYNRQCRARSLWWEESMMNVGCPYDHACKNRMDNIAKIAKSQGKQAWWNEVKQNDVKLQQVIVEYQQRTSMNRRSPRSLTLQYMETVVASTAVITEEIGEMMSKRQWMAFADTVDGNKLTESQAEMQWSEWKSQIEEPGSSWPPSDKKGRDSSGKDGELRIWVKTKDIMKLQNSMTRSKTMQAIEKEKKNASESDVGEMHKKIQLDHDMIGGASSMQESLRDKGAQMVKSGGADCFTTRGIDLPDVESLGKPDDSKDGSDVDGGEDVAADGSVVDACSEPRSKKPKKWFDYDKVVPKAKRAHDAAQDAFRQNIQWVHTKASEAIQLAEASTDEIKNKIHSEFRVLQNRFNFLDICLTGSDSQLAEEKKKFSEASPGKAGASAAGRSAIGAALPCASYRSVVLMEEIGVAAHGLGEVSSAEELDMVKKKIADMRKPIKELATSVKDATKELTGARDAAMKPKSQGKGGKGKSGKGGGKGKAGEPMRAAAGGGTPAGPVTDGSLLLKVAFEHGEAVPEFDASALPKDCATARVAEGAPQLDLEAPQIFNIPGLQAIFTQQDVAAVATKFAADFLEAKIRSTHGRGGMPCPASTEPNGKIVAALQDAVPGFNNKLTPGGIFDQLMDLHTFGFARGVSKATTESLYLASLRYHTAGSKQVVMVPWLDVLKFMTTVLQIDEKQLVPSRAAAAFKLIDSEKATKYMAEFKLYKATIGQGSLLYTPAGWITIERSGDTEDSIGFLLRGLCMGDAAAVAAFDRMVAIFGAIKDEKAVQAAAACKACLTV